MDNFARHYIRDMIYAANDGIITTFAVVAGVQGAKLSPLVVLALGFANLAADGVSMAAGNYLGIKSERAVGFVEGVETRHAIKHAAVTWGSFMFGGLVPLLPFLTSLPQQTASNASVLCSAAALFSVGAVRTRITGRCWWHSGIEMLFVGALAGSVAYAAGWGVHHLLSRGKP